MKLSQMLRHHLVDLRFRERRQLHVDLHLIGGIRYTDMTKSFIYGRKGIPGSSTGAKAADPGITTLNGYSEDFSDLAKCKQIALNQIEQGAGVIFQVAGGCGLGALDAAKEKGVWGIGVDADQSYLGPHILTSAVKRVDTAVFDAIKLVVDGKFKGGNIVFGLKDNGVGLGKISPKVPKSEVAKVMKVRADIIAGKITVACC